jgi:hypothetical protein
MERLKNPATAPKRTKVEVYQPSYSEKVEADNGAVFAIDLKTARHFAAGVEAGVYDEGTVRRCACPM